MNKLSQQLLLKNREAYLELAKGSCCKCKKARVNDDGLWDCEDKDLQRCLREMAESAECGICGSKEIFPAVDLSVELAKCKDCGAFLTVAYGWVPHPEGESSEC